MRYELELLGLDSGSIILLIDAANRDGVNIECYVKNLLILAAGKEYALQQIASSKE